MGKELKELILKLKSAGLNSDVEKLYKFASDKYNKLIEKLYSVGGPNVDTLKRFRGFLDDEDVEISLEVYTS